MSARVTEAIKTAFECSIRGLTEPMNTSLQLCNVLPMKVVPNVTPMDANNNTSFIAELADMSGIIPSGNSTITSFQALNCTGYPSFESTPVNMRNETEAIVPTQHNVSQGDESVQMNKETNETTQDWGISDEKKICMTFDELPPDFAKKLRPYSKNSGMAQHDKLTTVQRAFVKWFVCHRDSKDPRHELVSKMLEEGVGVNIFHKKDKRDKDMYKYLVSRVKYEFGRMNDRTDMSDLLIKYLKSKVELRSMVLHVFLDLFSFVKLLMNSFACLNADTSLSHALETVPVYKIHRGEKLLLNT